jgi:hypothetical protein
VSSDRETHAPPQEASIESLDHPARKAHKVMVVALIRQFVSHPSVAQVERSGQPLTCEGFEGAVDSHQPQPGMLAAGANVDLIGSPSAAQLSERLHHCPSLCRDPPASGPKAQDCRLSRTQHCGPSGGDEVKITFNNQDYRGQSSRKSTD